MKILTLTIFCLILTTISKVSAANPNSTNTTTVNDEYFEPAPIHPRAAWKFLDKYLDDLKYQWQQFKVSVEKATTTKKSSKRRAVMNDVDKQINNIIEDIDLCRDEIKGLIAQIEREMKKTKTNLRDLKKCHAVLKMGTEAAKKIIGAESFDNLKGFMGFEEFPEFSVS